MTATQFRKLVMLLLAGGGPMGRQAHIAFLGQLGLVGTRDWPASPNSSPGNTNPGFIVVLDFLLSIRGFGTAHSLTNHLGPVCLWRSQQGHLASDNLAPSII